MVISFKSLCRFSVVGVALLSLSACESMTRFSELGHGGYQGNNQQVEVYNYKSGVVYPDANGNEQGFQALGRDLSGGSVEIYSLRGPQNVMPTQQEAPLERFPVSQSIPVAESSVTVFEIDGATMPETARQLPSVALPPPSQRGYPSPFVQTGEDGPLISATPAQDDTHFTPEADRPMTLTGPRMTAP